MASPELKLNSEIKMTRVAVPKEKPEKREVPLIRPLPIIGPIPTPTPVIQPPIRRPEPVPVTR